VEQFLWLCHNVHISAVERAGLSSLNEGQVVEYEEVSNKGKTSAENLRVQRNGRRAWRYLLLNVGPQTSHYSCGPNLSFAIGERKVIRVGGRVGWKAFGIKMKSALFSGRKGI
jgi:'Cold-shock' DNA-binding domain